MEAFSSDELKKAGSLAKHIALAVSNALLFAEKDLAAQEMRLARDKIRTLFSCLAVAVLSVDGNCHPTEWNVEFDNIHEELKLESLSGALNQALQSAVSGERCVRFAYDEVADRSWSIVAAPLSDGCGATAAIQEVTDRDRAQKELSRLRRLAEIGQMTAAIAHEIRNPLTGISGAAQMLCDLDENCKEFSLMIKEEAERLNELCNSFLEFARPLTLNESPIDLKKTLQKVVNHHESVAQDRGVTMHIEGDDTTLIADQRRIEQVAHNLILNAIQACSPGDRVVVHTGSHGFYVSDTGAGMSEEQIGKLFTPFFTTKAAGTGLGLSSVRKIIEAHGGEIKVNSNAGHGTTFEVEFDNRRIA
jgi:signal transduction histidine kinase